MIKSNDKSKLKFCSIFTIFHSIKKKHTKCAVTDNVGRGPGKELPERGQASVVKGVLISVVNALALSDVKLDKDE